jgi:hypothetical protein
MDLGQIWDRYMVRTIRDSNLETRTARARLKPNGQPYYRGLEPGLHLGYRKPRAGAGKWLARRYVEGRYSYHPLGTADDFGDPDGASILSYKQAQDVARRRATLYQSLEQRIIEKALDFLARDIEPGGYLYRHYHPNGDLLYVGFSLKPLRRQAHHIKAAGWRTMICRILIEPFETREQAIAAEEAAIRDEFPGFNTTHNKQRHPFQEIQRGVLKPNGSHCQRRRPRIPYRSPPT